MAASAFRCEMLGPEGCEHAEEDLFRSLYIRHRDRSYCGSAVRVRVAQSPVDSPAQHEPNLVVFAHFRPSRLAELGVGDRLQSTTITQSLQQTDPANGEWVQGHLVQSRTNATDQCREWIFEIHPSGRWYYPWSGVATVAMRSTEHLFEVIAFERGGENLEVVALAATPRFRLMSFRRAAATSLKTTSSSTVRSASSLGETIADDADSSSSQTQTLRSESASGTEGSRSAAEVKADESMTEAAAAVILRQLATLLAFLRRHAMSDVRLDGILAWEDVVHREYISQRCDNASTASPTASTASLELVDLVVRTIAHVWLDAECCALTQRCFNIGESWPSTPATLRRRHAYWLERITQHTNRFLRQSAQTLLSQLARDVAETDDETDDRDVRHSGFDLASFIAQSRQRCALLGRRRRRRSGLSLGRQLAAADVWLCTTRDVGIRQERVGTFDLSVLSVLACWRQLRCVRCLLLQDGSRHVLAVASVFNGFVDDGAFLQLILDGRARWFESYPSGCATAGTTLNGYVLGDYVGRILSPSASAACPTPGARITTFVWPTEFAAPERPDVAFALHWTLAWPPEGERLVVDVAVESASMQRPELPVDSLRIADKLELVEQTWAPLYSLHLEYRRLH
ncbi:hypothetical protein P43SY_001604 [Pythium insidiosum]|uniref:Uncharacterized protein n=1 Tax=Pythium insidiosum TaxID=114742 RepID=A0AAD5Q8S3_PYTIN|nr:hypothetical protein P43SY_001604 [Pythium insidiosum]